MTNENDDERAKLRELMKFTQAILPEYSDDPMVQGRVGKLLADAAARVRVRPINIR